MNALTRKKRATLRDRRVDVRMAACVAAHRRHVLRGEAEGLRCWDCRDIPLFQWEVEPHRRHVEEFGDTWPTGIPGDPGMDE